MLLYGASAPNPDPCDGEAGPPVLPSPHSVSSAEVPHQPPLTPSEAPGGVAHSLSPGTRVVLVAHLKTSQMLLQGCASTTYHHLGPRRVMASHSKVLTGSKWIEPLLPEHICL